MAATVAMTVVLTPGPPTSLDLHGSLTPAALTAALASLPPCTPRLQRHTDHHHTLTLPPPPFPAGRLCDLLTGSTAAGHGPHPAREPAAVPCTRHPECARHHGRTPHPACTPHPAGTTAEPERLPPTTPLQREVLLDAMTHPGAGLHVEQLHWRWYGPLDARRFTAAWQNLHDSEAVLRTALAGPAAPGTGPLIAVHPHAAPQLERHPRGSEDWHALLLSERMREFDLHRPGTALRIALLEEPGQVYRILLTYHQALLDGWSARLLRRTLYRAYLADGRPLGSERRPDLRDHMHWLARRNQAPARAFWARAGAPAGAAGLPGRPDPTRPDRQPGAGPRRRGHGRTRQRLTPNEALRLRHWAADRGATESTALHTVWALQLHRAAPTAPAVAFAAAVSGRGIPLPGADRLPGPLRGALPLHVRIDPATPLTRLLTTLAGQALEAASHEWVSPGQAALWSPPATNHPGPATTHPVPDSLIAFEATPPPAPADDPIHTELATEGIRVGPAETIAAHTARPLTVTAHHDADGALVLTCVYDRTRIADSDAAETLAQTTLLLRELPHAPGKAVTTVADALALLDGSPVPRVAAPTARTLRILRAASRTGAGTICLVPPPDAPPGCYDALAAAYPGPQALTTVAPPADATTVLAALRPALARGEPLLLAGFSGAGSLACAVAERIASHGWHPPLVAIGGALTTQGEGGPGPDPVRALARTLETATAAATTTARP
ncbi:condensation domain-containing protein [Streptomyces avidinii]|uniref:condensation domain-containing protein n=1 Tax=Streptomyces avidinii TaxID=1895 RepID=UPI0038680BAF|nr:condensation domain-containing protein [Streptomyces avidinii]WTB02137.1 condensation domain-containing protein [Streptomyces avidinii]